MMPAANRVHVAVGVIQNKNHEFLIAKRAEHLHQGGLWEFPGGKVEKNETVQAALHRELKEELGITVETASPLISVVHDYPDKSVLLDVWLVEKFSGHPQGKQLQPLQWVTASELKYLAFPQANREIVRTIEARYTQFPSEIVITGSYHNLEDYALRLQNALRHNIKWLHLRAHSCSYDEYDVLYQLTHDFCARHDVRLTVNTSLDWFCQLRATGLHFTAERLVKSADRPVDKSVLFGASCHNLAEIQYAEKIKADYILLGSVFTTATHPMNEPIGLEKFADWVKKTSTPVFALGGVNPEMKEIIKDAGGYGVAGISSYWGKA